MPIGHRFFLTVFVPVLLCLFVLSVLLYAVSRRELEKEYENRLIAQAKQTRILVADAIEHGKSDLSLLLTGRLPEQYFMYGDAGELDYQEDIRATLEEKFLAASKSKPQYASLRLFALDGEGLVNITQQKRAYKYPDPRKTEWFNMAPRLKKDEVYVSHVHPCPEHQLPSIYISKLFYHWETPKAIAALHFHMREYFDAILEESELTLACRIYMVDPDGWVIASSDPPPLRQHRENVWIIQHILTSNETIHIENDSAHSPPVKAVYFATDIDGATGVIQRPLAELETMGQNLIRRLAGLTTLTVVLLAVVIYFSAKSVSRPLAKLEQVTKKIAAGDLDARTRISGNDEIGSLSLSFDIMAQNLQKSQNALKRALAEVKNLSGLLPICSHCKRIRDDSGYWNQIELYIREHSEAEFSHSICPDCARELYPDFNLDLDSGSGSGSGSEQNKKKKREDKEEDRDQDRESGGERARDWDWAWDWKSGREREK